MIFTAIFLAVILPMAGDAPLPAGESMIAVTFIAGLIPGGG